MNEPADGSVAPFPGVAGATAVVTGGGRGIGRAIVKGLSKAGARVVAHYHTAGPHIAELVQSTGATPVQADLALPNAVEKLVQQAREQLGQIDMLVNNAGVLELAGTETTTDDSWYRTLQLNLTVPFALCRAVIPAMRDAGRGVVVNVTSIAGVNGGNMGPAYAASKGGLIALTKALAREHARAGVRVNAVAPTLTDTDMVRSDGLSETIERILATNPMGRLATPEEVAGTVLFLCSNHAQFVNGQCVMVTGGP